MQRIVKLAFEKPQKKLLPCRLSLQTYVSCVVACMCPSRKECVVHCLQHTGSIRAIFEHGIDRKAHHISTTYGMLVRQGYACIHICVHRYLRACLCDGMVQHIIASNFRLVSHKPFPFSCLGRLLQSCSSFEGVCARSRNSSFHCQPLEILAQECWNELSNSSVFVRSYSGSCACLPGFNSPTSP